MFFLRPLRLEARQTWLLLFLLLAVIAVQVVSMAWGGTLFLGAFTWRFIWLFLIAWLVSGEAMEQRAFWLTRPIPKGERFLGKGLLLFFGCFLPPILGQVAIFLVQPTKLPSLHWSLMETILPETFFFLLAVAAALFTRDARTAIGVLVPLWFFLLFFQEMAASQWAQPFGVRGGTHETTLVFLVLAIPSLLMVISSQLLWKNRRKASSLLVFLLIACLGTTWVLRTQALPWRLDPAPLEPIPWEDMENLRFRVTSPPPAGTSVEGVGHPKSGVTFFGLLEPETPLPRGFGLAVRQVNGKLELPSGKAFTSRIGGGKWFCQSRVEAYLDQGVPMPPCKSTASAVPLMVLPPLAAESFQTFGARLKSHVQLDLFEIKVTRVPLNEAITPGVTGCGLQSVEWLPEEKNLERRLTLQRTSFQAKNLLKHHLDSNETQFLLLDGSNVIQLQSATGRISAIDLLTSPPKIWRNHQVLQPYPKTEQGLDELPPDLTLDRLELVCENHIYADRTIIDFHLERVEASQLLRKPE